MKSQAQIAMAALAFVRPCIAEAVIPERRSLIRDRNACLLAIPARASLGRDDDLLAKLAESA
jgi:hypothetical protein